MESAQATAGDTRVAQAALDTYQRLTVEQVIADLPRLGVDELLLVESLEQAGEARPEVLDRIDDLLSGPAEAPPAVAAGGRVGQAVEADAEEYDEYDQYDDAGAFEEVADGGPVAVVAPAAAVAPAAPVRRPAPPAAPSVAVPQAPAVESEPSLRVDLLDQMGGLLERAAARSADVPVEVPVAAPAAIPVLPVPDVIGPRRRGRKLLRTLKVLIGLVLVAAVVAAGAMFIGQKAATSTGSQSPATPVPGAATAAGDPMTARLISGVPGFAIQVDATGATGPADLAAATKEDAASDAQQALTRDGFVRGYQRVWTNTPQRHIVLTVYQFGDAAGASAYAQRRIAADRAALKGTSADFPVPAVAGAVGISSTSAGGASSAVFTKDGYMARLSVILPTQADEAAMAQQLAAREVALL